MQKTDSARPEEGDSEVAAASLGDAETADDGSIAITLEDFVDDLDIELEGDGPSAEEQHRAYALVGFLRGILPRLTHATDAANAYLELAVSLGSILGDEQGALEACRTAFRRRPRDLHVARAYRKAAVRADLPKEVTTAIEAEAKRTTAAVDRAALQVERALLLERHFANDTAARFAFKRALDVEPTNVIALWATERAALADDDFDSAMNIAQKLAANAADPKLRAEHLARAARHLERLGDTQGALALAASARLDAPESPAVIFALERLCASDKAFGMLVALREHQIADGIVHAPSAWFDVGIVAAYVLGDHERAVMAFTHASAGAGDEERSCLEELAWLHHRRGDHSRESDAIADQLPKETEAWRRAALWHRLARVRGEHLNDEDGTVVALEAALAEAPSYYPVLADAGRIFHRSQSRDRLINMHRLEADGAVTHSDRGGALRRLGEILVEDEATSAEGIEALREALQQAPGHMATFVALERALEASARWTELADLCAHELEQTKEPSRRAYLYTRIGRIARDHLGDPQRAIECLREAALVDTAGGAPPLLCQLADLLESRGELDELVPLLSRIAEETSDASERASIYERLASAQTKRGRLEDAMLAFKRAVQTAPASHPAHAAAGRAFLRHGRYRELLDVLRAGLAAAAPRDKAMWYQKIAAIEDRHLGRTDDAIKTLTEALENAPDAFPVRQTLIEILTREERYRDLAAVLPGGAHAGSGGALRRGIVSEASGDLAAAAEHYGRAVELGSKLARIPMLRVNAMLERWEALERHYAAGDPSLHDRYRAAEIAHERLGHPDDAVGYLTDALSVSRRALSPVVAMLPLVEQAPKTHVRLLELLESLTPDVETKTAALRLSAHAWERLGDREEALQAHLRVLAGRPADPVSLVAAQIALEQQSNRHQLKELLTNAATCAQLEPQLHATMTASLGMVLEQLGELREAIQAYEASRMAAGDDISRDTLLALYRLYLALDVRDRVPEVLETLASCPPGGSTQAAAYRRLATWWWQQGEAEKAADALRAALTADSCDYASINFFAELPNVGEPELIDVLTRALELETDPQMLQALGSNLAARLLLVGRWHTARETVDRVLAHVPDALSALMLLAETHERRKSWELAAQALQTVSEHREAAVDVQLEALRRLATLQVLHLHQEDAARATADRIATLGVEDELGLRAKLEVLILVKDDPGAASTLAKLTDRLGSNDLNRLDDLMRLAALQDNGLADPRRALATLTRISRAAGPLAATKGLLTLGELSLQWTETAAALRATLAEEEMSPEWECALCRRLAQILRDHLGRADEAVEFEKRILELDPSQGPGVIRTPQNESGRNLDEAIAHHRQLLDHHPEQWESYRALRSLFLSSDDRDAAFCAEAVLVGLGIATDEEDYFYQQRRAAHAGRITGTLSQVEVKLLCPERDDFVVRVFKTLDPLVPRMFAFDRDGYEIDERQPLAGGLADIAAAAATLFGVSHARAFAVSPSMGPAIELDEEDVYLLLPRTLVAAPAHEQRFVCAALLARAALGGVATDPRRLDPFSDVHLEQLLIAALAVGDQRHVPSQPSAIYLDLYERLGGGLGHLSRGRLEVLAREVEDSLPAGRGSHLRSSINLAAARAAVLCAGDPALAIQSAVTHQRMFTTPDATPPASRRDVAIHALPRDFRGALAFAVSETHARLRQRLFEVTGDEAADDQ